MTTPVKERAFASDEALKLPRPFVLRRLHSLLGLWLVVYLCQHLLVNSQAALFFQDDGYGFISAVGKLESIPYLKAVELIGLALPFLIHGIWGMYYAQTARLNAHQTDGSVPMLPHYKRNRAFSWQRFTSWLLVFGILAHVVQMRFWIYPAQVTHGEQHYFMVRVKEDKGLALVAEKLHAKLYSSEKIQQKKEQLHKDVEYLKYNESNLDLLDHIEDETRWLAAATKKHLKCQQILAVAPNPGGAFFLIVRETFKSPLMVILYTLFVIAATFHAFNGLWTFMIKWGITLTRRSQKRMRIVCNFLMAIVTFLGLMAVWGTYWTIQFQG